MIAQSKPNGERTFTPEQNNRKYYYVLVCDNNDSFIQWLEFFLLTF